MQQLTPDVVSKPRSLHEVIAEHLREEIVSGRRMPGSALGEVEIAAEFQSSRNPVREAFRLLEAEGFVASRKGRGVIVAVPDADEIAGMLQVRRAIEPLLARLAAENHSETQIAELVGIMDDANHRIDNADFAALTDLNSRFHLWISDTSGNRPASRIVAQILAKVAWTYAAGAEIRGPHSWTEHARLVDAIVVRDGPLAESLMRAHMDAAGTDFSTRYPKPQQDQTPPPTFTGDI